MKTYNMKWLLLLTVVLINKVSCESELQPAEENHIDCSQQITQYHSCVLENRQQMHDSHRNKIDVVQQCFTGNDCVMTLKKNKRLGEEKAKVDFRAEKQANKEFMMSCWDELREKKIACVKETFPDYVHRDKPHSYRHEKAQNRHRQFHMCQIYNGLVCPEESRQSIISCLEAKSVPVKTLDECIQDRKQGHRHQQHGPNTEENTQDKVQGEQDNLHPKSLEARCQIKESCFAKMSEVCQLRYKSMKEALCQCSKEKLEDVETLKCLERGDVEQSLKDRVRSKMGHRFRLQTNPKSCQNKCDPEFIQQKMERKAMKKNKKQKVNKGHNKRKHHRNQEQQTAV